MARPLSPTPRHAALDEISKRIIEELQTDGRKPYAAVGKAVGLSEAAVRQRVQRLQESGVIQIVAVTDPVQVGFTRQAMLGVRTESDVLVIADRISALEGVDYVVVTTGTYDLLVEVYAENDESLLHLINNGVRAIDGVISTETFVYLRLHKQLYNWGTR